MNPRSFSEAFFHLAAINEFCKGRICKIFSEIHVPHVKVKSVWNRKLKLNFLYLLCVCLQNQFLRQLRSGFWSWRLNAIWATFPLSFMTKCNFSISVKSLCKGVKKGLNDLIHDSWDSDCVSLSICIAWMKMQVYCQSISYPKQPDIFLLDPGTIIVYFVETWIIWPMLIRIHNKTLMHMLENMQNLQSMQNLEKKKQIWKICKMCKICKTCKMCKICKTCKIKKY